MKFFTKQERLLVILLSIGLVSGIGFKFLKKGFVKKAVVLELIDKDESIENLYKDLNNPVKKSMDGISDKINLNTADKDELIKLSGVGPALAERILNKRNEIGQFNSIEDLKLVKGIGVKLLQKNIDKISIGNN